MHVEEICLCDTDFSSVVQIGTRLMSWQVFRPAAQALSNSMFIRHMRMPASILTVHFLILVPSKPGECRFLT